MEGHRRDHSGAGSDIKNGFQSLFLWKVIVEPDIEIMDGPARGVSILVFMEGHRRALSWRGLPAFSRVSILVFMEGHRRVPHKFFTRKYSGVSILVFMEGHRRGGCCIWIFGLYYSFNPCFYGRSS